MGNEFCYIFIEAKLSFSIEYIWVCDTTVQKFLRKGDFFRVSLRKFESNAYLSMVTLAGHIALDKRA